MNPARRTTPTATAATAVVLATAGALLGTAAPVASAATTCTSPVYKRQFFANTALSGTPKRTDCDTTIAENWGAKAPSTGLPKDNFGVRWTVTRDFGSGGPFTLTAATQDGIRVYLDGKVKVNLWKNVTTTQKKTVNLTIPAGKHTLRIDYASWTGNANVNFAYTTRTSASVDKVKPLAPTGSSATYDTSSGRTKLTWAKNKEMDLAGYKVYRRLKDASFGTKPIATTTSTSYTDVPLPETGATYYYEFRAYDKAGNVSTGSADKAVTTVDRTAPAAPTGVSDNGTITPVAEANLNWDPNTEPDLAGYRVYRSASEPVALTGDNLVSGSSWTISRYDEKLPPTGGSFYYVVTAVDTHGNESAASLTAVYESVDTTEPTFAPDDLKAVDGERGVTLTWTWGPDADDDIAYFSVFRDGIGFTTAGESYMDAEIERSTTHIYWVQAVDRQGNFGPASNSVTIDHVGDYTAPAAVTGLTSTAMENGVRLDWDDSPAEDVAGYRIHRGVYADGAWAYTDITDSLPYSSVWSQNRELNLPDGENLRYVVAAIDKDGNVLDVGSASAVDVTELDLLPTETYPEESAILDMESRDFAGEAHLTVDYTADHDTYGTAIGYYVYRWDRATGTYVRLTETPVTRDHYSDYTAPIGTTLFYKVTAVYADGTESAPVGDHVLRADSSA
ncbi:fibronectin type III domain-containing protein [Streptomyces sp. NBC_00280]|uniref:fibronectin type III domain-containing protein n=1 Tax=Streptomyces sp. NBC_00280 TaxID=2975699 RepID=UPI0032448AE3